MGYLPQHPPGTDGLTVRELVALGRYPWRGPLGRYTTEDQTLIDQAIADTGLGGFQHRAVDTLSGGERQRAWIAMLLAQQTRCLLLDEPISALDVKHQVETLRLVHRLAEQRELTVIVVLHDVDLAARFCDRLVALKGGQLIARRQPQGDHGHRYTGSHLRRAHGGDGAGPRAVGVLCPLTEPDAAWSRPWPC